MLPRYSCDGCHSVVVIGLQLLIWQVSGSETLLGDDILIRCENNYLWSFLLNVTRWLVWSLIKHWFLIFLWLFFWLNLYKTPIPKL